MEGERHTILAVVSGDPYDPYTKKTPGYGKEPTKLLKGIKCRGLGTKIDSSILDWIKKIALSEERGSC